MPKYTNNSFHTITAKVSKECHKALSKKAIDDEITLPMLIVNILEKAMLKNMSKRKNEDVEINE